MLQNLNEWWSRIFAQRETDLHFHLNIDSGDADEDHGDGPKLSESIENQDTNDVSKGLSYDGVDHSALSPMSFFSLQTSSRQNLSQAESLRSGALDTFTDYIFGKAAFSCYMQKDIW